MSTPTTPSAHVCTATTSSVTLPALTDLTDCSFSALSNVFFLISDSGQGSLAISRHPDAWGAKYYPNTVGIWTGVEVRRDAAGTEFQRNIYLVVDDHGELVEVATC